MRPVGVRTESVFDADSNSTSEKAYLLVRPDSDDGIFFTAKMIGSAMSSAKIAQVAIDPSDAERFKRARTTEARESILNKYVARAEGGDKYSFPEGAIVGSLVVGAVLEITPAKVELGV